MSRSTRGLNWQTALISALVITILLVALFGQSVPHPTASRQRNTHTAAYSKVGNMTEMIMVAGHSVITALNQQNIDDEASWFLEDSQRGQLSTYLAHIEKGVELAAKNPFSVLIFSGGQTRAKAGPKSEALSYWTAATAKGWWGHPEVAERALLEEYARDSLENLMYSMCRFREANGAYPKFVTVVSYSYKRERFSNLHRAAIQFPESRFTFVGIDPQQNPYSDEGNIEKYARCHGKRLSSTFSLTYTGSRQIPMGVPARAALCERREIPSIVWHHILWYVMWVPARLVWWVPRTNPRPI